jgi:hypothetical protein
VRRFPKIWGRTAIVRDGELLGFVQRRGLIGMFDARTAAGGGLGSFSERHRAIAALEEFANRKRRRRKDVESAARSTSAIKLDFEDAP